MPTERDAAEVIIVGAGPVGLALALGLAREGRSVLVLEREASTAEHSRAPAIWPRTQEILHDLGVLEAFLREGTTLERIDLRDVDSGGALLSLPLGDLRNETPFPRLLILPQSDTERLLREAVGEGGSARVRFSAEVEGIRQGDGRVSVLYREGGSRRRAEAAFAVGCDGAHSRVRRELGIPFEGETYGTRAALADVRPPGARDLPFPRLSTRGGLAVAIRMKRDLWRLILPFAATEDRPLDERVERAAVHLFPEVESAGDYETVWRSEFRLHRRSASRWVDGRIALAGDAAHLNSPVGGQGMNAGIQDAATLAPVLVRALERGDGGALAEYASVRRRAIEGGVNVFTDRLTRLLLFGGGRAIRPVLRLARGALRIPALRRRFLRRIAMLD